MVDTSILIDYFRRTDKSRSRLVHHFKDYDRLYISSVTEFEIVTGARAPHIRFWDSMLSRFTVLDFDSRSARKAAMIVEQLKVVRKTIAKPDLFIASTALVNDLDFDTLNVKHFIHIEGLRLAKV